MTNTVLNDGSAVYYAVIIEGRVVSPRFSDRVSAEQHKQKLAPAQQRIAEVQIVDDSGRQLLLG